MSVPTLNWGIIGTGLISSWFVDDLLLKRSNAKAVHNITAIGASSNAKAETFKKEHNIDRSAFVGSYQETYACDDVDIIYIGLPHVFHKEAALAAMSKGKHILVEKPATINADDFKELVAAAKKHKVFLMEAMWLRFRPLILDIQRILLKEKELGEIHRLIVDFSMDMGIEKLPENSRLKSNELGAGALLDVGVYSLTYARVLLDDKLGEKHTNFDFKSFQTVCNGIDYVTNILIQYENQRQAIVSCSVYNQTPNDVARIECELGQVVISGSAASLPEEYRIEYKEEGKETVVKKYPASGEHGLGFYYEADAVAVDIAQGKLQDDLVPWAETILVLETIDSIRREGGVVYPQDK